MRIDVNAYQTIRGWSGETVHYATIERDHVPQIGATMRFGASVGRRALTGWVRSVIETDDPSAPDDRPTVAIVVEEIA